MHSPFFKKSFPASYRAKIHNSKIIICFNFFVCLFTFYICASLFEVAFFNCPFGILVFLGEYIIPFWVTVSCNYAFQYLCIHLQGKLSTALYLTHRMTWKIDCTMAYHCQIISVLPYPNENLNLELFLKKLRVLSLLIWLRYLL